MVITKQDFIKFDIEQLEKQIAGYEEKILEIGLKKRKTLKKLRKRLKEVELK